MPPDCTEPAFEPLMRTSLQSFRFLSQTSCTPRPARAVEITRTSLQSLILYLFDAFCSVHAASHGYISHTSDGTPGILFDTHVLEMYSANAYFWIVAMNDSLSFSVLFSCWLDFVEHFDMLWKNNTSGSLSEDYNGIYGRNVGI